MLIDYSWTLRDANQPKHIGEEAYMQLRSQAHARSAQRLLELFQANGGIYIKLGQHIAALVYLLPNEYCDTMRVLQNECPPTSLRDIEALFESDMGVGMADLFEAFDPEPLGVASLAQVHRATLSGSVLQHGLRLHRGVAGAGGSSSAAAAGVDSGAVAAAAAASAVGDGAAAAPRAPAAERRRVAVKIQHPSLDQHAAIDIQSCAFFVRLVKRLFPAFEFEWLASELQSSLPQELDFRLEAANAERVRANFANSQLMRIPEIVWADRRILVMEYVEGGKIDDPEYMQKHGISPEAVSADLTKAYSEMIFRHGFVHCDPHPGNVFVRPCRDRRPWWQFGLVGLPKNYEIVLLDHGLYRTLSDAFRLDYAHFWDALIRANEPDIEHYAYRLFLHDERVSANGVEHHRLFASMVSGRSWEAITMANGEGLTYARTDSEVNQVKKNAQMDRFLIAIADILAKLPRELLLLLKTNDLLRAIDSSLGVSSGRRHLVRMVSMMGWYCADAICRETVSALSRQHDELRRLGDLVVWPLWTYRAVWEAWLRFLGMTLRLSVLRLV
ncbi:hypothetical protein HK105_204649 [Polyrhizophydium stewartii]|uniref:ABC1 atypical kinase-like domain-containing protein n=1 Tax=Polyrhizophydium stewartii TaxID=2732419 RepID=A0ABR4N8C7_9FUNG|nr:putative aarF domain-containing protein kinase 1 [Polyrhizophydium stewartii]